MRGLSRTVAAVGGAIVLSLSSVSMSHAAPSSGQDARAAGGAAHCVVTATPNMERPTLDTKCFDTFARSVSYATGGKVKVAPGQRTLESVPALEASTVVGIEYKDSNFGGASLILNASTTGFVCTGGAYVNFGSMPSGWDNTIGSARSYSGCKSGHSEYTNNGGSLKICGCATMGAMNDKTSSIRFSASGI